MSASWNVAHRFRRPAIEPALVPDFERKINTALASVEGPVLTIESVQTEFRFNIETLEREFSPQDEQKLEWLLSETFERKNYSKNSFLPTESACENGYVVEVGSRLCFTTAWSTNAVAICNSCGLDSIRRIERSRRYAFTFNGGKPTPEHIEAINKSIHDRMTEFVIHSPILSFEPSPDDIAKSRSSTVRVPVVLRGREALVEVSDRLGLAFDDWDLDFYTKLFRDKLKRDPSDVECFDLAQSNSEHSRHWFFGGRMIIDGVEKEQTLFRMVKNTNPACRKNGPQGNSVIAFHDNSSAIRGFKVRTLTPSHSEAMNDGESSPKPMRVGEKTLHGILTAETHNFPCGIAPFPGAETGTGGRIRDVQATGRGARVVAGTSSYCVGNLHIPDYFLQWEDPTFEYPANMATPLQIEIEASNGASDYGNKFGEPVICGYSRSFGMRLPSGERREWIKPIMMSSGVGLLDAQHVDKGSPEPGMVVVKVGGPAYRIGMGGGAASSRLQGEDESDLDFNAVQRGDGEMENKMNRVIIACIELGVNNPIISIHDQGAGGSGNVLKEIAEPLGAEIHLRRHPCGDQTLTSLELWTCEFQENCGLLIAPESKELFKRICERENVPFAFMGTVASDGIIRVIDEEEKDETPVELALEDVLSNMGQKTFQSDTIVKKLTPILLPENETLPSMLDNVLRLLQVGSKRFLTTKVDRCVSGLVAQQQCVGPLHTPLADVGVIAQSHFPNEQGVFSGVATAIGEQPIIGLTNSASGARMSVCEALTNLVFAKITDLADVKCSANWMWAAKLPGEGAAMYEACEAMCQVMSEVGIAVDGGKDSLSMAANAGDEVVKCPGQVCISVYAMVPDVSLTVTPDFKHFGNSIETPIFYIPIGRGIDLRGRKPRLGGSALAQVYQQLGDTPPDLDNPENLVKVFNTTQSLIGKKAIAAGHDISDGGLIVCALEMAFAGNCGVDLNFVSPGVENPAVLFVEEPGLLLQAYPDQGSQIMQAFSDAGIDCFQVGTQKVEKTVSVKLNGIELLLGAQQRSMCHWRDVWEATSFKLDALQANPKCVDQEKETLRHRKAPPYRLGFEVKPLNLKSICATPQSPRVAILREEGSNGDREMAASFTAAGFEAWDVSVTDLRMGKITLDSFRGMAFVGGFSFADVLDSAKGWAACIRYNKNISAQFQAFYNREDTFSFGACNGCQLMALLGWVPGSGALAASSTDSIEWDKQPRFIHNESGRYESRFTTVKIREDNRSIMLKGMEGSVLGVWVAHAEGRAHFPNSSILDEVLANGQAPLRYVDDDAKETEAYPCNPNGSPLGIAALCSENGRHLAMMPHPERACLIWQWPYVPESWKGMTEASSPWSRIFQNAYNWCTNQ